MVLEDHTIDLLDEITQFEFWERDGIFETIRTGKTTPNPLGPRLTFFRLRCRFNTHRGAEIWALKTDPDIELDDLWEWAERDYGSFSEMVRKLGVRIPG